MKDHVRRADKAPSSVGVLIATYRRPEALHRCLEALQRQDRLPDEVLVIVRPEDSDTRAFLDRFGAGSLPIRVVDVKIAGAVAARNAGLDACRSDVVAIIDDDTAPRANWLRLVLEHFVRDPALGGLGGRDRCFGQGGFNDAEAEPVGKITWFGNVIGNHHLGFGDIREVDILKGANMSFRAEAFANVRFDSRLKGSGAQPGEDGTFTVAVKCAGWKISYDPAVIVEHFPAERNEVRHYVGVNRLEDKRPFWEFCYNQVVMVWGSLSLVRRIAFFLWSCFVGSGVFPGIVQAVRFTPSLGWQSWQRFWIAQSAKIQAFRDLARGRGLCRRG